MPNIARKFVAWVLLIGIQCGMQSGAATAASAPKHVDEVNTGNHWAFRKPVEPAVPAVKNAAWVKSPIDAFIFARLEEKGLKPAPPADKRTLIRRAYFDLIGLPPEPEEVDAFIADRSTDAFAKVVEKLLASPHYGERWGRYWLDVARYSDTKGYVFQEERRFPYAFTFRDYVIRSFNEDKPYDRFLMEQIAADLLPLGEDKRPLAAMGFVTLGRRFINVKPDIMDDRMDVVCRGTMGLTVGCARCHNHKFDPIPTADYYSLYSIFNNSPESKDPPLIGTQEKTPETEAYQRGLALLQGNLDAFLAKKNAELVLPLRTEKKIAEYLVATQAGAIDQKAFLSGLGPSPYVVSRWRKYLAVHEKQDTVFAAWRAYVSIAKADFAGKSPNVTEKLGKADAKQVNRAVVKLFVGNPPASLREVAERYAKLLADFDKPQARGDADEESVRQVLYCEDSPVQVPNEDLQKLFKRDSSDALTKLKSKIDQFTATNPNAPPRAMVLEEAKNIEGQYVFLRGSPGNHGPEVKPHFLTCIAGPNPAVFTHGSGRLELAQAIASRNNPLTARVMVNRVWLHHFGLGIVRTPSDFGTRGDPPTHPELLDYLAVHFMNEKWSIKQLHRQIMLSATYQMSSDITPDAAQQDPQNQLLSHFNRQRLDFEGTRDALIAVGGKMDAAVYGRSVDITIEPFSTRRSVYAYIDRQNLPGVFRNFDFASPDATCPRRFVTTIPQQALFMMNSPVLIEQAKNVLARPEVAAEQDPRQKIIGLYRLLFDRMPAGDEITLGIAFLGSEGQASHDLVAWQYGYGEFDEATHHLKRFTPLPHFTGTAWQGGAKLPDKLIGHCLLTAQGGHPGNDQAHAVIRRWTSPLDGVVKITGMLANHGEKGDGVRARIVSSRRGELASWNVFQNEAQTALENVQISRGDTIDFVVDCRSGPLCDSFTWAPTVRVADNTGIAGNDAPEEWNAAADFGGPEKAVKSLSPWEKYVQVLLESNEFVFVD
jgi:hypothetical protein